MYLELCLVSAARSLEQILFSKIHLFFTGKVRHNFENIICDRPWEKGPFAANNDF